MTEPSPASPARQRRQRATSPRVRWIDRLTTGLISVGGIAVIVCVLGIFVYLVAVAAPLFGGAKLSQTSDFPLLSAADATRLLFADVDEYNAVGCYVLDTGEVRSFDAQTGATLTTDRVFPTDQQLTAWSRPAGRPDLALGFADGSVRLVRIHFTSKFLDQPPTALPDSAQHAVVDGGVVQRTSGGEWRRVAMEVEARAVVEATAPDIAIQLLDYRPADSTTRLAVLRADGDLRLQEIEEQTNLMTGETTQETVATTLSYAPDPTLDQPGFLLVSTNGQQLVLGWREGTVMRFDLRDRAQPTLAERLQLTQAGVQLTVLRFMLGEQSILAGDSAGIVRAWLRVPQPEQPWPGAVTADDQRLVVGHTFGDGGAAITAIATSQRDKSLLATNADGRLSLYHLTSEGNLADTRTASGSPVLVAQIAPKSDGLFAVAADGRATHWRLDNSHPETTFSSLFGRVWYEGAPEPSFTWQSSSGTDDFEPKLSLIPLIFGTLKATFYSMLFAVPVALLAAIYTSEFLDRRLRGTLKSLVEVMAALPSVVLGFMAALVLAPMVENSLVAVGLWLALIPVGAQLLGHVWQTLPKGLTLRFNRLLPFALLVVGVAVAAGAAMLLAPGAERLLFAGDVKAWLDGRVGGPGAGWAVLLWPLSWVGLTLADRAWLLPVLARRGQMRPLAVVARRELLKSLIVLAASIALAWAGGMVIGAIGFDPRPSVLDTYVQRNALLVGFVMGFAVIPIIYTIAEDSLNAVPARLRSASLGCGATPWQTASRVVLPVAASGIFSALMIGLGRAVGETMIVLMAAGNTAVLDVNPFNGMRTLAANIAVELPEAVKEGTLYRVLFLAALTLLVFTSIVNTLAEIVRIRFRKRAFEL